MKRETHLKSFFVIALVALTGCGSNWRMHEAERVTDNQVSKSNAPDWVKGKLGQYGAEEGYIYFVGRSSTPDMPRSGGVSNGTQAKTPNGRTGFTVMDERDAIQSARTDIQDQILQRLMPRNFGTTGQIVSENNDVGTCVDCGVPIGMVSTGIQARCNEPCYQSTNAAWTNAGQLKCASCSGKVASTQPATFATGGVCSSDCKSSGNCSHASSGTLFSQLVQAYRKADYLPMLNRQMALDLNMFNIGIDSVMPALLAKLQEKETYFEKWQVHEGDDENSRPNAEGYDEWHSYKCWVLSSIPEKEFDSIVDEFRGKYQALYAKALERIEQDRNRRIELENLKIKSEMEWQKTERAWNRADELKALDHARELDKDREPLPGRRFKLTQVKQG